MKITESRTVIELNGKEYTVRISDIDVLATAKEIRMRATALKPDDHDGFKAFVEFVISKIDEAIGSGAIDEIFEGTPIKAGTAISVYNAITEASIRSHSKYIAGNYGG